MKPNIRDYMNKNNITSSSRESQEYNKFNFDNQYNASNVNANFNGMASTGPKNAPVKGIVYQPKYLKSKSECLDQLTAILEEIDRKDAYMNKMFDAHNTAMLRKFNDDYDHLMQQIIRNVENNLRENKERILADLRQRRGIELAEAKPIRRNMDKLRSEIIGLKDGLQRDNEYREYISKIVLKDYELDLNHLQQDIDRIRLPGVELGLDDKDELAARSGYGFYQQAEELNSHTNRDQIKRSEMKIQPSNMRP